MNIGQTPVTLVTVVTLEAGSPTGRASVTSVTSVTSLCQRYTVGTRCRYAQRRIVNLGPYGWIRSTRVWNLAQVD